MIAIAIVLSLLSILFISSTSSGNDSFQRLRINGNDDLIQLAEDRGWDGDGSVGDPFIIRGYTFESNRPGTRLFIGNTTVNFVITECYFLGGSRKDTIWNKGAGLELYNVSNGDIYSNYFGGNRYGILLTRSSNITVNNNQFKNNSYGVCFNDSIKNIAKNNVFDHGGFHFTGPRSTYTSQTMIDNQVGEKQIIYHNNEDMNWAHVSKDVGQLIIANVSRVNIQDLNLEDSNILVAYSSKIEMDNIVVTGYREEGILIYHSSDVNLVNSKSNFNKFGLRMIESSFNNLDNNYFRGNLQDGIRLDTGSDNNVISNSTLSQNAISIYRSRNNLLTHNIIYRSIGEGLKMQQGSYDNIIYDNALLYNNRAQDTFNASRIQARDETGLNRWNSYHEIGNYWNDWTDPDEDGDGIVDNPYDISGSDSKDWFPLTKPPMSVIPSPPRNLTILSGNSTLNLVWNIPLNDGGSDIRNYRIYRGELPESQTLLMEIDANETNYIDTELDNEVPYYYRVSAVNSVGESVSTQIIKGVPDGTPPELHIEKPLDNSYHNVRDIQVKWNGSDLNSGIDHFQVRIGDIEWIDVGWNTTYTFYDLTDGRHDIRVRAVDNAGNVETQLFSINIDTVPPDILYYEPVGQSISVDTIIKVIFSEPMDMDSLEIDIEGVEHIEHEWVNETTLHAHINGTLNYGYAYQVYINGSDLAGNDLTRMDWSFKTITGGGVYGNIVDKAGKPISGVQLALEGNVTFSGQYGEFKIETNSGRHTVLLTKEGYEDKELEIEVIAGEEVDLGDISMNQVEASGYDMLLIIASAVVVITGMMALVIFIIHEKNKEELDDEIDYEEDADELPPEFLE